MEDVTVTIRTVKMSKFIVNNMNINILYKKLSYCWETVRRESMPRIAVMDAKMTT